ncbi:MAG: tetratricopeptide repeat protein [Endomicrobiaceae bacterium]|nr:tetratricopeptide repeat protein [Endomicrobiaceae bacterium]
MFNKLFEKNFNTKVFLVLAIVIFALYGKSIFFNFVYFDDDILILEKQNYLTISNIKNILTDPVFARENDKYYRPVLNLSFLLDKLIYNINPHGYHFTNILIHLFAVFSIFILFSYKYDKNISILFSIIFAVHPTIVKAVAWIPGRNDSLLALFCVLSFYFFVKYCETYKKSNLIFHILFFTLSLFTKETATISILIYGLYIIINNYPIKRYLNIMVTWIGILIIFFLIRYFVFSYQIIDASNSILFKTTLTNLPVLIKYIQLVIFPINISILAAKIDINYFTFFYTIVLFFMLFFLSKNKISLKLIVFYIIWFLLYIIPSCLVPNNNYDVHRIYLPMVGIFLLLLETLKEFYVKKSKIVNIFLVIVSLMFFLISFNQTYKFKDKKIFWVSALVDNSESAIANANVAGLLSDAHRYEDAEKKYLKAILLEPWESKHYVNLSVLYIHMNNIEKSEKYLLDALNLNKYNEMIYYNLAQIYNYQGKKELALEMKNIYLEVFKTQNRYDKPLEIKIK